MGFLVFKPTPGKDAGQMMAALALILTGANKVLNQASYQDTKANVYIDPAVDLNLKPVSNRSLAGFLQDDPLGCGVTVHDGIEVIICVPDVVYNAITGNAALLAAIKGAL